jgi:alpha-tubulin suppressor-like RCC1 family protein
MKSVFWLLAVFFVLVAAANAQTAVQLPDRNVVKLLPDPARPRVYALNRGNGTSSGTLVALNSANGAVLAEISLGLNPTDMALSATGDALYAINTGGRTLMKVDLSTFTLAAVRAISTPNSYDQNNALHVAAGSSNLVYFTDGGWSPGVYSFNFPGGTNISQWDDDTGIGGLTVTRDGRTMFSWRQYGWSAGDLTSWVTRFSIAAGVLTRQEISFSSGRRDPFDTPVLLNDAETLVFNKQQVFAATNVSILIREFGENIYGISRGGELAFGNSRVYSTWTGMQLTNLPIASTVQTVSSDNLNLFLYHVSPSEVVIQPLALLVGAGWETNQSPIANFTRTPTNATTLTTITFDGSSSSDDQGQVGLEYRWDWENDGVFDTSFTTNSTAVHRYSIAGTKTALLQVKDRYGAVSAREVIFNVVQQDDPGLPGGGNPIFEVQFAAADVVFDPVRPYAYLSDYPNKRLVMLNLATGLIDRQFTFEWMPESIAVSPNGLKMYVALLRRNHSPYWFDVPTNYVAEFDLVSQVKTREFQIQADPGDLAVTDNGILIVPGGSDQWTEIRTFRTSDGQMLGTSGIREMSRIALHPSQRAVYTADTDLSPSDIRRYDFDPVTGAFISTWDSIYHGDYAMSGNVWCFPSGSNVLVAGGNVFTSSSSQGSDMRFVRALAGTYVQGAAFDPARQALFTVEADDYWSGGINRLRYYNLASQEEVSNQVLSNDTRYVFATSNYVFVAAVNNNRTFFQRFANPASGAETNQSPIARFTMTPTNPTTLTMIAFDGSNSSDDQGGGAALQYRWDWENDGAFDTPFSSSFVIAHRYSIPGTKTAALQVKDRYGAVNTRTLTFNVAQENDPGVPGGGNAAFEVQFAATDVVFDPVRPYAYISGFTNKTLAILNLTSGFIERQFTFDWMPESIAVSPNGLKMYVALLRRPHSPYWFDVPTNFIAEFDLTAQVKTKEFRVLADPYDLAVTDNGILIMPGGSDQWTDIQTYRTSDGQMLGTTGIREMSRIALHPSQRAVYTADTDSSPSDIRRYDFDPVSGVFTSTWDSIYHGDYAMAGNVWCFPSGSNVLVRGGNVFTSSSVQGSDMRFVRSLAGTLIDAAAFDPAHDALFTVGGENYWGDGTNRLRYYNLTSGELVWSQIASNGTRYVHATSRNVYLGWVNGNRTLFQRVSNPALPDAVVTQDPQPQTATLGGWASFQVGVRGASPFTYQWFFGAEALAGQTNSSLLVNNVQATNAGGYFVVVTNPFSSATSAVAQLSVLIPPSITQQPSGLAAPAGGAAQFTVQASGTAPLRYQWSLEGLSIIGATNATLVLSNLQPTNAGVYRVIVSNVAGSVLSASAVLRVIPVPPTILSGPTNLNLSAGSTGAFSVTAAGSAPFTYEWRFNGTPLSTKSPLLTLSNVQAANAGNYQVIVANSIGAATSSVATLTVTPSVPIFVSQPVGGSMIAGTNNFSLVAVGRGSDPISYQWLLEGTNLPGATRSSLVLSNISPAQSGSYANVASNAFGVTTSAVAVVSITGASPVFLQQPSSLVINSGGTSTMTALAQGSEPMIYQWRFQGTNLPGATGRSLTISNASASNAGPYTVIVSNGFGVASATANVTVILAPAFTVTLTNMAVDAGANVTLSVAAQSSGPISYSWLFNGVPLANSSSNVFLTNVRPTQAGVYRVTAANQYGSASATMTLAVFRRAGSVAAWGDNVGGQRTVPSNLVDVVSVAGGDFHSLALTRGGSLAAWGYNGDGQTTLPPGLSNVVAVAAGASHSLAVRLDGRVTAWGRNDFGQILVPNGTISVVGVAAGEAHSVAVRQDGTLLVWGDNSFGQRNIPQNSGFVTAVAAGRNHTVALRNNGTVLAWGLNSHGQCIVAPDLSSVTSVAAGYLHSMALRADGTVVAWGDNTYGQTNIPSGLSNVIAIAAGELHSMALLADGHIVAWGDNMYGQLDIPAALDVVSSVGSGYYHGLAVVPPMLKFGMNAGKMSLWWNGNYILQQSSSATGPFEDVASESPNTKSWIPGVPARFFRLRSLP